MCTTAAAGTGLGRPKAESKKKIHEKSEISVVGEGK